MKWPWAGTSDKWQCQGLIKYPLAESHPLVENELGEGQWEVQGKELREGRVAVLGK